MLSSDSSDFDAEPLHRAPAPSSPWCCDTATRSRAELQELAEVGVPLMIAGPSWSWSVGMTSRLCWSRLTEWLYGSFCKKRAWLTSCAGKQLRYLFAVMFVSPWNCLKVRFLFFLCLQCPEMHWSGITEKISWVEINSSQTGAIKSLHRQNVLGNGDTDQVLWLCLANKLI